MSVGFCIGFHGNEVLDFCVEGWMGRSSDVEDLVIADFDFDCWEMVEDLVFDVEGFVEDGTVDLDSIVLVAWDISEW